MKPGSGKGGLSAFIPPALWKIDPDEFGGTRGRFIRTLQIATLVLRDFWNDQCFLRASALTFTTILSIVPFFALAFAVLKGFGVPNRLEPLILNRVAAGSQEIVSRIVSYINNTNMRSLGAIGLTLLVISVIVLLASIEEAFNVIWGVREDRSLHRKFSDYLSVVISAPLLLFMAVSATTSLENQAFVKWLIEREVIGDVLLFCFHLAPYVSIWVALIFLYIFIPNTKVRFVSALIGGVLAGTIWQIAQWGYLHFQVGVGRYNAIYGTLSILPVFMIWIYTSWLIVLFGVEVVYAHQNRRSILQECHGEALSSDIREEFALTILLECAVTFHEGDAPPTDEHLADRLELPLRQVKEILGELERAGFLCRTSGDEPGWHPAREPGKILVRSVLSALRQSGAPLSFPRPGRATVLVKELLDQAGAGAATALDHITVGNLVSRLKEQ